MLSTSDFQSFPFPSLLLERKKKLLVTLATKFGIATSSLRCISDLCLGSGDFNISQFCLPDLKHLKLFCVVLSPLCLSYSGGTDILNR